MQNEIYQKLGSKMMPIVEQYAKEHEFSLVLDPGMQSSQVLFYDPTIEITDDIVKRYDAAGTAPAISKPAAAKPAATAPKPVAPPAAKPK
jgi:hypothetical protein